MCTFVSRHIPFLQIDVCHNLLNFLRKCKDSSHRVLCENLVRVPSRRVMPQYYDVVSQPIDLIKIQQRLRTDGYQTVQAFLSDVKLLLDNVRCFYEPSSQDFKDATFLEEMFLEKVKELIGHMRDSMYTCFMQVHVITQLRMTWGHSLAFSMDYRISSISSRGYY